MDKTLRRVTNNTSTESRTLISYTSVHHVTTDTFKFLDILIIYKIERTFVSVFKHAVSEIIRNALGNIVR